MHTALALTGRIQGLSSLVVGMPECTVYSRFVIPWPEGKRGELHWMYVLDAGEVVFGFREGLTEAVRRMAGEGARYIMLILTCVPELIGEDMEGMLREIRREIRQESPRDTPQENPEPVRLSFVFMGHFKCNSYPRGYWKTFSALGDFMEPRKRDPRAVNVLGGGPGEERLPPPDLIPLLQRKGFRLRFLSPASPLEDFLEAPDAALNLVLSPLTDPLALMMEGSFGIARVALHNLYDIAAIDRAYGVIAEKLGISWGDTFAGVRQEALRSQEQIARGMKGLRCVFAPMGSLMPIPLAVYLAGLGVRPLLMHIEDFYPADIDHGKELNALGFDPPVCYMANYPRDLGVVESLAPDLCLGSLPGGGRIPSVPALENCCAQFGYERICGLRRLLSGGPDVSPLPPPLPGNPPDTPDRRGGR
jgi:hypothetical protein